ncbi:hypothetical protein L1987_39635 [Smallanthus sonchifolius]|uniref:Uncharacterized protein n=1 Tax=Smallanthus sonchifolius TaxID=185202 RepID=A0ACB9HNF8_9ASTR|nr:hypothetical protein L1987_39635 [Smallanthus sonchifolius]
MASIDPSLISDPTEQKWVSEISEILKHQLEIDVEIPPVFIFKIPETITTEKPESYEPQHIGFGPYNHFRPGPYAKMEQKKLAVLQKVLQYHQIKDFRLTVLDKVEKLVPVIRACYEMFLQDDNSSMGWVFAIDGVFLLNLFKNYDPTKGLSVPDVMMLENQIPYTVLMEIDEALHSSSGNNFSPSVFRSFSEIHSPLKLCSPSQAPTRVEHLLHYMYHSIINNFPAIFYASPESFVCGTPSSFDLAVCAEEFNSVMDTLGDVSDFVNKPPPAEIVQLYEKIIMSLQKFSTNKIIFPSASKLEARAGFKFVVLPKDKGIVRTR